MTYFFFFFFQNLILYLIGFSSSLFLLLLNYIDMSQIYPLDENKNLNLPAVSRHRDLQSLYNVLLWGEIWMFDN